jgi:hypothetical protein
MVAREKNAAKMTRQSRAEPGGASTNNHPILYIMTLPTPAEIISPGAWSLVRPTSHPHP